MNSLSELLELADRWRHLPSYQLERRVDLLFAPFLSGFVQHHVADPAGFRLSATILPELPIRNSVWTKLVTGSLSKKVDYCFLSSPPGNAVLLELKTDMKSRSGLQDKYLNALDGGDFNEIIQGICRLAIDTEEDAKYYHLVCHLEEAGVVQVPGDLKGFVFPERRRGVSRAWREVRTTQQRITTHVCYLQPIAEGERNALSFKQFKEYLETQSEWARDLSEYVDRWISPPAEHPPVHPA